MVWLVLIREGVVADPPAIRGRSHTDDPAKDGAEVALIAEAYLLADVGHGLFCFGQKRLGAFDAEVVEVGDERKARHALEEAHEVRFAHAADARRFPYLDGIAAIFAKIAKERAKPLQVLLLALVSFDGARIGGILIHEQDEKHLEVGFQSKPATRRRCGN